MAHRFFNPFWKRSRYREGWISISIRTNVFIFGNFLPSKISFFGIIGGKSYYVDRAWSREPMLGNNWSQSMAIGESSVRQLEDAHTDTLDEFVCRLTGTDILLPPIPGLPSTHLKPNPISYPPYPSAFRTSSSPNSFILRDRFIH